MHEVCQTFLTAGLLVLVKIIEVIWYLAFVMFVVVCELCSKFGSHVVRGGKTHMYIFNFFLLLTRRYCNVE